MGAMKDLHIEQMNLEAAWADLLGTILVGTGDGSIQKEYSPDTEMFDELAGTSILADMVFEPNDQRGLVPVEIRVYRWDSDWVEMAMHATQHLQHIMTANEYSRGVLLITQDLTSMRTFSKGDLRVPDGIEIWDLSDLRQKVEGYPDFKQELENLVAETLMYDRPSRPLYSSNKEQGAILAQSIRSVPAGKDDATAFELACESALKYLFSKDIVSWKRQNRTTDQLNRMDLIGRIQPNSGSFWSDLSRDFGTRYVVFEAKNYSAKIGQGQVLTTEKYLFPKALRSVAIIVARNGASDNALKTIEGSLREQGKLMLVLSMDELCSLLDGFDRGDAPENILYEKLDFLLMEVGR